MPFSSRKISVVLRLIPKRFDSLKSLIYRPFSSNLRSKAFLGRRSGGAGQDHHFGGHHRDHQSRAAEHILTIVCPIEYIYEPKINH